MKKVSVLIKHHAGPTGDVLICRKNGGPWEFPVTKVRTNEVSPEAAERAAWEQVGIYVSGAKLEMIGHNRPMDGKVEHIAEGNITHDNHTKSAWHAYYTAVNKWQTEPVAGTYDEFKWVHPTELAQFEFAGDDVNFLAKYDPWVNGREIKDVRMF
jgi:8-oxo-dGTP pyrophosphatase MutT (NUDIX family)